MELVNKVINRVIAILSEWGRRDIIATLYYNYVSPHIIRINGGKVIIYKHTKLYFEKEAKLILENGVLRLGSGKPYGAKNPSLIRILKSGVFHAFEDTTIEYDADILIKPKATLIMKKNSYINCKCIIRCSKHVEIGENSITATELDLRDSDGHELDGNIKTNSTIIGDHVWIGTRVTILEGVTISDGCMIGACSLVTKDIPRNSLAYGVPASVKRENIRWKH